MFVFVFDEQVNHVKQNINMFKLFNLLKSRLNNIIIKILTAILKNYIY